MATKTDKIVGIAGAAGLISLVALMISNNKASAATGTPNIKNVPIPAIKGSTIVLPANTPPPPIQIPPALNNDKPATTMPVLPPGTVPSVVQAVQAAFSNGTLTNRQAYAVSQPYAPLYNPQKVVLSSAAIAAGYTQSDYLGGYSGNQSTIAENIKTGNLPPALSVVDFGTQANAQAALAAYMNNFVNPNNAKAAIASALTQTTDAFLNAYNLRATANASGIPYDATASIKAYQDAATQLAHAQVLNTASAIAATTPTVISPTPLTPDEQAQAQADSIANQQYIDSLLAAQAAAGLSNQDTSQQNLQAAGGVTDPSTGITAIGDGSDTHYFDENGNLIM